MTAAEETQQQMLHTPSILRTQLKAAAACTLLAVAMVAPLAAVMYAAWLYCPNILLAAVITAELGFAGYYFCVLVHEFNAIPEDHEPVGYNPQEVVESFLRHMKHIDNIEQYLSQWFLDAPFERIRLDNLKELCAFALYYKTVKQMEEAGLMPQLDMLMEQLQAMHNFKLPEGYNPDLQFMSHLWGRVPHIYRPLFFYVVMEFLEVLCWGMLRINGYRRHTIKGCVYYTHGLPDVCDGQASTEQQQEQQGAAMAAATASSNEHDQQCLQRQSGRLRDAQQQQGQRSRVQVDQQTGHNSKKGRKQRRKSRQNNQQQQLGYVADDGEQLAGSQQLQQQNGAEPMPAAAAANTTQAEEDVSTMPLVFLHGVGAGLLPYVGVIFTLATLQRPMILPVWKHVSMRLTRHIPTVDDGAEIVLAAMQRHGVKRAAVVGHSYGSCIAARIVKTQPHVVHTLALLDPVCFAMYMPNLVKHFLYTTHLSGHLVADFIIALLSTEIHCARNFCRNFFWTNYNLWDEHLPERTLVALSGLDVLCPTSHVREWLETHTKAKVLFKATAAHGAGLLFSPSWQCTILHHLVQLLQSSSASEAVAAQPAAAADGAAVEVVAGAASAADDDAKVSGSSHAGSNSKMLGNAVVADNSNADADDDDTVSLDSNDWDREPSAFMALPITGLEETVDLDALIDAASELLTCFVEVVRSSTSSLQQQGKGVWEGLGLPTQLPQLPVQLPQLPVQLPQLPPWQQQQWWWQQQQQEGAVVRRTCSADVASEQEGYGQWLRSAWVGA